MAKSKVQRRKDRQEKHAHRNSLRRTTPTANSAASTTADPNIAIPAGGRLISYTISPDVCPNWNHGLSDEQADEVNAFTDKFLSSTDRAALVSEAEEMVRRYPQIAQMKMHLLTAYGFAGRVDDAARIRQQMLDLHPEYLFGKLTELHRLMDEGRHDEVPERFGNLSLDHLLGGRTEVHPDEMLSYCVMSGRLAIETDRMDSAEASLKMMESIAPDNEMTATLRIMIEQEQDKDLLEALEKLASYSKERSRSRRPVNRKPLA
jgi:hypothetical protein